jgi:hypothetical protein
VLRPLLFIAAGLFLLSMGVRSISGFESEVDIMYGGKTEIITCEEGKPVAGNGAHTSPAEQQCAAERDDQRGRAKWWLAAGLIVTIYGITRFKKARSG